MRDLLPGLAVIGIGLFTGTSIFLGNFSFMSILFDAFGVFFVGKGLYGFYKARAK